VAAAELTNPLEILNAYFDGRELSAPEARRLTQWITSDQANAIAAVELGFIHEHIDTQLTITRLLEEIASSGDPNVKEAIAVAIRNVEEQQPAHVAELRRATSPARSTQGPGYRILLTLAASILLVAGGFWMYASNRRGGEMAQPKAVVSAVSEQVNAVPADIVIPLQPVVAMVSESLSAKSDTEGSLVRGMQVRAGESLRLREGVLQLTTTDGADVVVEAPAEIEFDQADKIRLTAGKLTARVAQGSARLTIQTPTATVVDLGTEFGVAVGPGADTKVAVYEGMVQLAGIGTADAKAVLAREISAGRAGYVDATGTLDWTVVTLPHRREFIRPDEVAARRAARRGSDEAQQQASFYQLQRIAGLMAYQGFDIPSDGADCTIAFRQAPVRSQRTPTFTRNLHRSQFHSSGSLRVDEQNPVYLDLDTSTNSPLAQAGLLDDRGLVGRSGAEIWLSWQARSTDASSSGPYAGVSLMFGDLRLMQEPIFVGTEGESNQLSLVANVGSRPISQLLDRDPETAQHDAIHVADQPQRWVIRVSFGERADKVAVWCDVPLDEILSTPPQAEITNANVVFDRLRLDVGRGSPAWEFDDFYLSTQFDAIAEATRLIDLD
jgi:hypothetical protein